MMFVNVSVDLTTEVNGTTMEQLSVIRVVYLNALPWFVAHCCAKHKATALDERSVM